ncbi:probable cytochrome P450 6a14 [Pogonomyrmex barbatus]|uniref:Probable cytochrome P450 6a14 n=1 Tax=Pogonomyrmex barbatus TaxID=144034 RepID=A0A6I9W9E2_9HYME|nr:probable cytochrome P450 6a14 [Pogonomyrmex barbatus]
MDYFQVLCSIAAVILALYYFFTSTFDFWKSRGVPGPQPIVGFGNLKDVMLGKIAMSKFLMKMYTDYKDEPLIGIFVHRTPILIIKDLDLIKDVLIKDFNSFGNRAFTVHEKAEPLSQNIFNLDLKKWRPLRAKLTPFFTTRKLKYMFFLISECADHLVDYVEQLVSKNEIVECYALTSKYTTDVIGSCAFGIEMNSMTDETSEFCRIGRNIFIQPFTDYLRTKIKQNSPWLYDILGHILPQTEITKFFIRLVMDNIKYRDKNNIVRNDFIDILRELREQSDNDIEFTDSFLVSQAFLFFSAGFETSSTAMTNAFYELALNQKIQDRLREEINQSFAKYGNNLSYENIKEMIYLDKVFKETLRKYPAGLFLNKIATSDYTFKGTKVSILKGQNIWIPFYTIQHDPNIYPQPDIFDPERFNEEIVENRHPMAYLPFSDGPRNCIGLRFAIYETKLGLIKMLRNFKFEPCEKTQIPYITNESTFVLSPKDGIYLKISKINQA